jgi:hypothetical protein
MEAKDLVGEGGGANPHTLLTPPRAPPSAKKEGRGGGWRGEVEQQHTVTVGQRGGKGVGADMEGVGGGRGGGGAGKGKRKEQKVSGDHDLTDLPGSPACKFKVAKKGEGTSRGGGRGTQGMGGSGRGVRRGGVVKIAQASPFIHPVADNTSSRFASPPP